MAAIQRYLAFTYQAYLFLFFLSGFADLIYEHIWSRYLMLFLGHADYAQDLTIMICKYNNVCDPSQTR